MNGYNIASLYMQISSPSNRRAMIESLCHDALYIWRKSNGLQTKIKPIKVITNSRRQTAFGTAMQVKLLDLFGRAENLLSPAKAFGLSQRLLANIILSLISGNYCKNWSICLNFGLKIRGLAYLWDYCIQNRTGCGEEDLHTLLFATIYNLCTFRALFCIKLKKNSQPYERPSSCLLS